MTTSRPHDKGKNLLVNNQFNSLKRIEVNESLVKAIQNMDAKTEKEMIDLMADESLQEFCRVNQYFSFNADSVDQLKALYARLNAKIRSVTDQTKQAGLDQISQEHYNDLCEWLVRTNKFAGTMYSNSEEYVQPVPCSEYPPDLQLIVLQIDLQHLRQPVLDVGCGRGLNLVNYLRENGIEAYGIDRFDNESPYYTKTDWLEYDFELGKWGSIISNLGFSNHFLHHNLRVDGNYRVYAQKYMEILQSLQTDGCFYYAPDLGFIEKHLDKFKYQCRTFIIEGYVYKTSHITKLS